MRVCLLVGSMLALATAAGAATIVAECGFNDALGINADGTPDSPYEDGATIIGRGGAEPGWSAAWP